MQPNETKTRKGLLKYLSDTAVAADESSVNELLELFNPDPDRVKMGQKFQNVLGYNPITQFDFDDIVKAIDKIRLDEADPDLATALVKMGNTIAKRAMAIFESNRSRYFNECLAEAGLEILDRNRAEEFSTLLIGRVFEDDSDEDVDEEGVASALDEDSDSLSFPGIDDDPDEFGLEEDEDE